VSAPPRRGFIRWQGARKVRVAALVAFQTSVQRSAAVAGIDGGKVVRFRIAGGVERRGAPMGAGSLYFRRPGGQRTLDNESHLFPAFTQLCGNGCRQALSKESHYS
jgi:hypothetical protein